MQYIEPMSTITHYIEKMYKDERVIRYEFACGDKHSRPLKFNEGTVTPTDVTCVECLEVLAKKAHQSGQKSE